MLSPVPTLQTSPLSSTSRALNMLLHANEGLYPKDAYMKDPVRKYLSFITVATMDSGCCNIRQPCLAKRAELKTSRSLKPKPPSAFDLPIFSQLSHAVFLPELFVPHQKLLLKELSFLHKPVGSLKTDILYDGIDWITALIKISLPACNSSHSLQPSNQACTLPTIPANVEFLALPTMAGNPRYFS